MKIKNCVYEKIYILKAYKNVTSGKSTYLNTKAGKRYHNAKEKYVL